jgi:hypothetical protein
MGRLSDTYANLVLDLIFSKATNNAAATYYIGLSSTTPTNSGTNVTEPSGGNYARVAVTNNATNFPAASGRAKSNGTTIVFPTATADWVAGANLTHFVIYDAASAGTFVGWGALTTPAPVLSGTQASFAAGDLDLTSSGA